MKKVLFMTDEKDELNGIKIILLALSILCCFVSYFGGRILPMGLVLLLPIFLAALVVSIFYIVKSTSIHAFNLFALYFLPFLICAIIGWNVDQADSRRCRKKLLEAKNYAAKIFNINFSKRAKVLVFFLPALFFLAAWALLIALYFLKVFPRMNPNNLSESIFIFKTGTIIFTSVLGEGLFILYGRKRT